MDQKTIAAALGRDPDAKTVYKFGFNADVGTSAETIWTQGGLYVHPAAASVMKVSSSSTADTSAGTGARTVTVYGLDANYAEISETVTLNGQTAVNTTKSFLRTNRVIVNTAGSGATNAGVIYVGTGTVTSGVPATIYASVAIGTGQTLMCVYTIPAGYKGVLVGLHLSEQSVQAITISLVARPFGGVFNTKERVILTGGSINLDHTVPTVFDEKTDIEVRGIAAGSSGDVSASMELLLVRNIG